MNGPQIYLEKISLFSRTLRREGLTIGPSETADACRILIDLGLCDRETVRTALRTVYANFRQEQRIFDRVFDGFFISEDAMRRQMEQKLREELEQQHMQQSAREELQFNGVPMEFSPEQRLTYASLPREEREKLRKLLEKYQKSPDRNPNFYGNFIHSVFTRAILEQQMLMENAGSGCSESDPEIGLLCRDISQFQDVEIPRAVALIHTITRQINAELSTRHRRSSQGSRIDFRRTIRKGLETGGSFYSLCYRQKPRRKKRLVLLCDVSGSMMQFSEFALRFIQSLNQVSESSRTFLFSEECFEADAFSLCNMDQFRSYVRHSGIYGRGTDLGSALELLCLQQPAILSSSTTLLILSDTKTIDQPRAIHALLEAKRLSGRVIWLNPIPQSKWHYIRSVQTMVAFCPMVSCSTLQSLAEACKHLAAL